MNLNTSLAALLDFDKFKEVWGALDDDREQIENKDVIDGPDGQQVANLSERDQLKEDRRP